MSRVLTAGPKIPPPAFGQPIVPNLNVRHLCPNCRSDPPNIIEEYSKGDLVRLTFVLLVPVLTARCVVIAERYWETGSLIRGVNTFAGDESGDDPSRVGDLGNVLLKNNFETAISGLDGRTGMSANLQRAQSRANAQSHVAGKTSNAVLQGIFAKITEKCEALQLPRNVITRAQHVYQIADNQRAVKNKKETTVIAACIIYASRDAGANRTVSEIGQALKVGKKDLGQVLVAVKSAVQREKQSNGSMEAVAGANTSKDSIEALLARYCNLLDIDNTVQNASRHVATLAMAKAPIDGRNPASIAAAVLYFTCILFERKTNAKEISEIAQMGESTIKFVCKIIATKLDDVIRPEWRSGHENGYSSLSALGRGNPPAKGSRGGTPKSATPQPDGVKPDVVTTGSAVPQ